MLREIRELGFDYAELSHGIRISLLPGIYEAVDAGDIRISSVHNFCPLPLGYNQPNPNIFKFTAESERERANALRYSIKSLETAVRVGAKAVVLHFGRLRLGDVTEIMSEAVSTNDTTRHSQIMEELMLEREQLKVRPYLWATKVVNELAVKAREMKLQLGLEIREAVEEVPLEGDYLELLSQLPADSVGYWHDIGHAQIKANLGFIHHRAHLESLQPRLIGFHLHDVIYPDQDHRAPGTGGIDFKSLASYATPDKIKVLELNPGVPTEEVKSGLAFLKSVWGDD